jgi:threonyl-tRNA synthetase
MQFSTHDPKKLGQKYVDNSDLWIETEEMVRNVLVNSNIPYVEVADEAAFYGPKIDVQVWSAIGREFTLATNQVDFAQPMRFGLKFMNKNNEHEMPLVIHRAPLGTHERFIGFLIEHFAGNFPVWLAPVQVAVLPISDLYNDHAKKISDVLKNAEIRTLVDDRNEKIGRKIRDAEMKKIPFMLIAGEKEVQQNAVSVRRHGKGDEGQMPLEQFEKMILEKIKSYSIN